MKKPIKTNKNQKNPKKTRFFWVFLKKPLVFGFFQKNQKNQQPWKGYEVK